MPEPKPDFKPITRKSADASQLPAGHARERAFVDMDSHIEILVEKWERELRNSQERKAA